MQISRVEARQLFEQLGSPKVDHEEFFIGVNEEIKEHLASIAKYTECETPMLLAGSITIDHLREDPHYYTKMKQLELQSYRIRNNQQEGLASAKNKYNAMGGYIP
jgi:hypothetical protein